MNKIEKYAQMVFLKDGGCSKVYRAYDNDLDKYVIIKCSTIDSKYPKAKKMHELESFILEYLESSYVPKLYDAFILKVGLEEYYYIIMEHIPGQDLADYLMFRDEDDELMDQEILLIFLNLAKAVKHVHDNGIAHRDIKPENFMISNNLDIKILDFGLSYMDNNFRLSNNVGTLSYIAPEFYYNDKNYDLEDFQRADMWSLGVVFYIIANGCKTPYDDIKNIPAKIKSEHSNKYINSIVEQLLDINPMKRLTSRQLVKKLDHKKCVIL